MDRITTAGLNRTVLDANQRTLGRIAKLQEQLSTGKRLNRVSDDPVAAKQSLRYRAELLADEKYLDNIAKSQSFMGSTEATLGEMSATLDQVKSLAVQGANATQDAASRTALGISVDALLTRLTDLANTVHDGRYLFAGTATDTKPFTASSDGTRVDYDGDLDAFDVKVGPAASVTVNQNGHELFKEDVDIFDALIDLRSALTDNDPQAVEALFSRLDQAKDHLNNLQGAMGGSLNRLELTKNQLESSRVFLGQLVSDAEDVDLTEAISQLQLSQVALEAGLQSGARVIQPSLIDFLR